MATVSAKRSIHCIAKKSGVTFVVSKTAENRVQMI